LKKILNISILGAGNVATHLARVLSARPEVHIQQMYNRHIKALSTFENSIEIIDDLSKLKSVDIIIISITDDAISNFSKQLSHLSSLVVHTSGSVSIDALQVKRKGVFYPFQTFSKAKKRMDFKEIPILIEANNKQDLNLLENLGKLVSDKVLHLDSKQRKALHIAGVFVANFVNHLYVQANKILKDNSLSFDLLKPLIQEVTQKITVLPPEKAQTGPAARGNQKIIQQHLEFLQDKNQKEIYKLLSESILSSYHTNKKIIADEKK